MGLTSMELGLTRREINTIMFQIDQDQDGNISYREFVPFAFDLLHKLTSLRLLETEMEHDELASFLLDLFKSKDVNMEGMLYLEDVRDLLHQAMLGLSRMKQIFAGGGAIPSSDFLNKVSGLFNEKERA